MARFIVEIPAQEFININDAANSIQERLECSGMEGVCVYLLNESDATMVEQDNTKFFPISYEEAQDRVYRKGQTTEVITYDIPSDLIPSEKGYTSIAEQHSSLLLVLSTGPNQRGKLSVAPVETIEDARKLTKEWIAFYNIGASVFTGGYIYHPTKGRIAMVSWNNNVFGHSGGGRFGTRIPDSMFTYTYKQL